MIAAHVASLLVWGIAAIGGQIAAARARSAGPAPERAARQRLSKVLWLEHGAFAATLATGGLLMRSHGWGLGHARWLALKLGLVAFLVLPLEAMHAYIAHVWIARGLGESAAPSVARDLERGLGIEEMLRALALPLLGFGLPLILWLSLRQPF
ncbi:MAG: hypothetical protein ACHQNV_07500 [Vicinamibacteria bacterium]